jgi:hypothetical protein
MRADGDGRFCERCRLHVADVGLLDADGLEALVATNGRVCARLELEGRHPRTKLGVAASFVVVVLAGCATPGPAPTAMPEPELLIEAEAQRAYPLNSHGVLQAGTDEHHERRVEQLQLELQSDFAPLTSQSIGP